MSTLPVLETDIVLAYVSRAVSIVKYCATVKLQMVCFQILGLDREVVTKE